MEINAEEVKNGSSESRKRQRSLPNRRGLEKKFACTFTGCNRAFTRREHLSRHQLNHNPGHIFRCHVSGCTKAFVRKDLFNRHVERHSTFNEVMINTESDSTNESLESMSVKSEVSGGGGSAPGDVDAHKHSHNYRNGHGRTHSNTHNHRQINLQHHTQQTYSDNLPPVIRNSSLDSLSSSISIASPRSILDSRSMSIDNVTNTSHHHPNPHSQSQSHHHSPKSSLSVKEVGDFTISTPTHTSWTPIGISQTDNTHGESESTTNSIGSSTQLLPIQSQISPIQSQISPTQELEWLFTPGLGLLPHRMDVLEPYSFLLSPVKDFSQMSSPPSFEQNLIVTERKRQEMIMEIPELEHSPEFSLANINEYHQLYWEKFHFQYPILHHPSFQVDIVPTPLFLSIILMGSSYAQTSEEFRDTIATPLRWLIFRSPSFHPPTRVWVLQSLLLLELYEKTRSISRLSHERAHIHHGTTIQLIRRGSTLLDTSIKVDSESTTTWMEWVEAESIKRAVFLAFVLDVTHSVLFSHAQLLNPNELQLSLPCDDRVWDSSEDHRDMLNKPTVPFTDGLRSMLKRKHIEAKCELGRLALLYGLLSQYIHISNLDLEASSLDSDLVTPFREKWSKALSKAIDFWWKDYDEGSKQDDVGVRQLNRLDYLQQYHYVYISTSIRRYELHVFCGDRKILGKVTLHKDYLFAEKAVYEWSKTPAGKVSAFHALQVLMTTFLNYGQPVMYSSAKDPYVHRAAIISHCALVYWAYCFCNDGPESTILAGNKANNFDTFQDFQEHEWALVGESGRSYLERCSKVVFTPDDLDKLEHRNRTVGLLKWVIVALNNSAWPMLIEMCEMMDDCVKRSLGWDNVVQNKLENRDIQVG